MPELEELVAQMRRLGVRKYRQADGLEIELVTESEASDIHPPPVDGVDPGSPAVNEDLLLQERIRNGKCVKCGNAKPEGLVPGHCRPCGKLVIRGN